MTNSIGIIIQARFDSTRLPGKAALKVWEEETTISFLLKRLKKLDYLPNQTLVLATADTEDCDFLEGICNDIDVKCFRGDKNNVFDRYYKCAKLHSFSTIVRITADCTLHCPALIQKFINLWHDVNKFTQDDFIITNKYPFSYCDGFDVEVFSSSIMEKYHKVINESLNLQEHVTSLFYSNPNIKKINIFNESPLHFATVRLVLDYPQDLLTLKHIISAYDDSFPNLSPLNAMNYKEITSLPLFREWSRHPEKAPNFPHLVQNSTLFI